MRKPNFFIIGAPKCGTTALYHWLSEHPQVYMSPIKEPHYFSIDICRNDRISYEQYLQLFNAAEKKHKVIGEASTRYLFSKLAIRRILDFNPHSKFIAMIRNPIDMAYSLHNHLIFLGVETEKSFQTAWNLSTQRALGEQIPPNCNDPDSLNYKKICLFGEQTKRFFDLVDKKNRLVIILDDLKNNETKVLTDVLLFLDLDVMNLDHFMQLNKSMSHRSIFLKKLIEFLAKVKVKTGIKKSWYILNKLSQFNRVLKNRKPLPLDLRVEMEQYLKNDMQLFEGLVGRDLSSWRRFD